MYCSSCGYCSHIPIICTGPFRGCMLHPFTNSYEHQILSEWVFSKGSRWTSNTYPSALRRAPFTYYSYTRFLVRQGPHIPRVLSKRPEQMQNNSQTIQKFTGTPEHRIIPKLFYCKLCVWGFMVWNTGLLPQTLPAFQTSTLSEEEKLEAVSIMNYLLGHAHHIANENRCTFQGHVARFQVQNSSIF